MMKYGAGAQARTAKQSRGKPLPQAKPATPIRWIDWLLGGAIVLVLALVFAGGAWLLPDDDATPAQKTGEASDGAQQAALFSEAPLAQQLPPLTAAGNAAEEHHQLAGVTVNAVGDSVEDLAHPGDDSAFVKDGTDEDQAGAGSDAGSAKN